MQVVLRLELWRWALWLASVVPIYYGAGLCVHVLEAGVEARFFTSRQAMYYAVSIKVQLAAVLSCVTHAVCSPLLPPTGLPVPAARVAALSEHYPAAQA